MQIVCRTRDKRNKAVYHTNVMLCVGTDVAIVCAEGVTDDSDRKRLLASLGAHQTVSRYTSLQGSRIAAFANQPVYVKRCVLSGYLVL